MTIRSGELFQRRMSASVTRTSISGGVAGNTISPLPGEGNTRIFFSLDDRGLPGFRMRIDVKKYSELNPDPTTLEIYNLGPESRSFFENTGNIVTVNAGYGFNPRRIFTGNVIRAITSKIGPDFVTKVTMASGLFAFNNARINTAMAGQVTLGQAIGTLCESFQNAGLNVPSQSSLASVVSPGLVSQSPFSGISFVGKTSDELVKILDGSGFTAIITDNTLRIIPVNGILPNPPITLTTNPRSRVSSRDLTVNTDTIGSFPIVGIPEVGDRNLIIKTLLNADLNPFQQVIVESRFVNGLYRINTVEHFADTYEGEYVTRIETNRAIEDGTSPPVGT